MYPKCVELERAVWLSQMERSVLTQRGVDLDLQLDSLRLHQQMAHANWRSNARANWRSSWRKRRHSLHIW